MEVTVGQQFYILQLLLNCRKSRWPPNQAILVTECIYCTLPWDFAVLGEFFPPSDCGYIGAFVRSNRAGWKWIPWLSPLTVCWFGQQSSFGARKLDTFGMLAQMVHSRGTANVLLPGQRHGGLNQWWLPRIASSQKMWTSLVQMTLGTRLNLGWSKHLNCIYCTWGDLSLDLLLLCWMTC